MKHQLLPLIVCVLLAGLQAKGQSAEVRFSITPTCSGTMQYLSYWWKRDSLANNGARFFSYDQFLKSKIDSVPLEMMLHYLGPPNRVNEEYYGTIYEYYVFDIRTMPKGFEAPGSCLGLQFIFFKDKKYLGTIKEVDNEVFPDRK